MLLVTGLHHYSATFAANHGYRFMKKNDLFFALFLLALILPFVLSGEAFEAYGEFNRTHGMLMSFVKFAVLATLGEMLGIAHQKRRICFSRVWDHTKGHGMGLSGHGDQSSLYHLCHWYTCIS